MTHAEVVHFNLVRGYSEPKWQGWRLKEVSQIGDSRRYTFEDGAQKRLLDILKETMLKEVAQGVLTEGTKKSIDEALS